MKVKNLTCCEKAKVTRAARVRKELQLVKRWELVIAKYHDGTTPLHGGESTVSTGIYDITRAARVH